MYGRGVAVSKSDFATYTFALRALQAAAERGSSFDGAVELHFTYDEETGGEIGPAWLLAHGLTKPRLRDQRRLLRTASPRRTTAASISKSRSSAARAMRPSPSGRRCARSGQRLLSGLYALRKRYTAISLRSPGHHASDARRRLDRGRHQHERRARQRSLPARSAHHPRRGSGDGRGDASRGDRGFCARMAGRAGARASRPARETVRSDRGPGEARRRDRARCARSASAAIFRCAACRSTPTRGITRRPACRRCSMARGRARSPRPTAIAPTSDCASATCIARPTSSRLRWPICCTDRRKPADGGRRAVAARAAAAGERARRRADHFVGHAVLLDRRARAADGARARRQRRHALRQLHRGAVRVGHRVAMGRQAHRPARRARGPRRRLGARRARVRASRVFASTAR